MTVVIDASVAFAGAVRGGRDSQWAREILNRDDLIAPELLLVEVASVARKAVNRGALPAAYAKTLVEGLGGMLSALIPHSPLMPRIWQLRENLTSYDAAYVALAEALDVPLATLDRNVSRAPGLFCHILAPR